MVENYSLSTKIIALSRLKGMGRKRIADFLEEVFSKKEAMTSLLRIFIVVR